MGSGHWSSSTFDNVTRARMEAGSNFSYDRDVKQGRAQGPHPDLDPSLAGADGRNIRESRDNPDHPLSTPIVVGFDSTGSMGSVPRTVQAKLSRLFGLLMGRAYATDPQICIATYGDATCDRVPLQVSQFESDNRIDENLDNLYLEGGGGGNNGETSQLLFYYLAHHTATDAWDKRRKRGYAFIIADEKQVPIKSSHVRRFIGDRKPLGPVDERSLAQAVSERWDVKILLIDNYSAQMQHSREYYSALFGDRAIIDIQDPAAIAETIAAVIGFEEGRAAEDIREDLLRAAGPEVARAIEAGMTRRAIDAGSGGGYGAGPDGHRGGFRR